MATDIDKQRARVAKLLGIEEALPTPEKEWERASISMEAEAVLLYYESPFGNKFILHQFTYRNCKFCEREFITSLSCVAYCSDACRKKRLQEMGIQWDPEKSPEERWAGPPTVITSKRDAMDTELKRRNSVPLVIVPETIAALQMSHQEETQTDLSEVELEQTLLPQSQQVQEDGNSLSVDQLIQGILGEF